MLLANNVMFVAAAGAVLLGTLYPLFLDALDLGKISVGPPYFNLVFPLVMAPALFLMGVGPLARWKQAEVPDLARRLRWAAGTSVVAAALLPFALGHGSLLVSLGLLAALWILASGAVNLWDRIRPAPGASAWSRLRAQPRGYLGMLVAHAGVAVFIVGVTLVKGYETEKDVQIDVGETVSVGPYSFEFKGVKEVPGPNYLAARGTIEVSRDGRVVRTMQPEKRNFLASSMPMTNAAIDRGITRDLYLSLGEPVGASAWIVRVYYKPFIDWIWGGCLVMACGGLLALSDRRYRLARAAVAADATVPAATVA